MLPLAYALVLPIATLMASMHWKPGIPGGQFKADPLKQACIIDPPAHWGSGGGLPFVPI